MKKIILIVIQFIWIAAVFAQHEQHNAPQKKKKANKQRGLYTPV